MSCTVACLGPFFRRQVFKQLGRDALSSYTQHCIVPLLREKANTVMKAEAVSEEERRYHKSVFETLRLRRVFSSKSDFLLKMTSPNLRNTLVLSETHAWKPCWAHNEAEGPVGSPNAQWTTLYYTILSY